MSNVVRLNDNIITDLEKCRNLLIESYSHIFEDAPEEIKLREINRWKNASYVELIERIVQLGLYYMEK